MGRAPRRRSGVDAQNRSWPPRRRNHRPAPPRSRPRSRAQESSKTSKSRTMKASPFCPACGNSSPRCLPIAGQWSPAPPSALRGFASLPAAFRCRRASSPRSTSRAASRTPSRSSPAPHCSALRREIVWSLKTRLQAPKPAAPPAAPSWRQPSRFAPSRSTPPTTSSATSPASAPRETPMASS